MTPDTFNAWHVVALGIGVAVTHVYHTVVNAGGLRTIWRNFIGAPAPKNAATPPEPKS